MVQTGTSFTLDALGERHGTYTIDGDGINCLIELLDTSNNVVSSTGFSN